MSVSSNSPVTSSNVNTAFMSRTAATTSTVAATTFSNTTQSTDKDTGAVILEGGLGVEKNVNVGGALGVTGNATVSGNLTVTGDLTINGTTTTLNTATVESEDNNILLNKGGNDASAEGGGIDVKRTSDNGVFRFDSGLSSKWELGLASAMYEVLVTGLTQTITGVKTFMAELIGQEIATPSTPASGYRKIYPKTDGWYDLDDGGVETKLGGGSPTVVGTRSAGTAVVAANGVLFSSTNYLTINFIEGSGGSVFITAAARIQAGSAVGQRLVLIGTSDANFIQMPDGNGVITGGQTIQFRQNSVNTFIWNGNDWVLESGNGLT